MTTFEKTVLALGYAAIVAGMLAMPKIAQGQTLSRCGLEGALAYQIMDARIGGVAKSDLDNEIDVTSEVDRMTRDIIDRAFNVRFRPWHGAEAKARIALDFADRIQKECERRV